MPYSPRVSDLPVLLPAPRAATFAPGTVADRPVAVTVDARAGLPPQGYRLTVSESGSTIVGADEAGAFYGCQTLAQLRRAGPAGQVRGCRIEDWPTVAHRGVMLDVSRDKVPTLETLEALVDRLASWKVNHLQLYMEHTFAYPGHDTVWAGADPYTAEDVRRLDAHCRSRHVELAANQNTLGHMERWLRHDRYRSLAISPDGFEMWGRRRPPMTMDPARPGALALARELLGYLAPCFTSPRVHVGLDEPWELADERFADYAAYISRLRAVPELDGREMLIWGDIVVNHPAALQDLPAGVTVCEWGYEADHRFEERAADLAAAGRPFWLCPGTSAWNSILGRAANARANIAAAAVAAGHHGANGVMVTDWGDNGHLQHLPVSEPWLAWSAAMAWCPEANARLALVDAVDRHVFADARGLGQVVMDLGDLHRMVSPALPNASIITANLYSPRLRMGEGRTAGMADADLSAVEDRLADATVRLGQASSGREDAELILAELAHGVRLVALLVRDARARLAVGGRVDDVDLSVRRRLAAEVEAIAGEHRQLWLARNREGGLADSTARLHRLRDVYLDPQAGATSRPDAADS